MFNAEELAGWIADVGKQLDASCSAYMIGGGALCFRNLKDATKDIDIIVTSKKEFGSFDRAVAKAGFKRSTNMTDEFYLTALAVYEKGESRIDVFLKEVGKMLRFTDSMKDRAKLYLTEGKLKVFLVANEDIFLFKAMTPRAGDIDDCDRLMREPLNYNSIYDEVMRQSTPDRKWYFWVYEKLCLIENQNGITTPIKNRLFREIEKSWKDKPTDFMSEVPNIEAHIPDAKLAEELKRGRE